MIENLKTAQWASPANVVTSEEGGGGSAYPLFVVYPPPSAPLSCPAPTVCAL